MSSKTSYPAPSEFSGRHRVTHVPTSGQALPLSKVIMVFLYAGVFTVSWQIARPGDLNFTFSDIAFACAILGLVGSSRLNLSPMGGMSAAWLFSLVLMLGSLFIGTLVNGDVMRWVIVALQYCFAYLLLPMMFASFDHKTLQRCVVFYVLGVTFSQAFGNITHIFFDYASTAPYFGNTFITGGGRLGSFSGNPNNNSAMAGFALVLLLYALDRRLIKPLLGAVCGLFLFWGIIASASFGGFVINMTAVWLVLMIRSPQRAIFVLLAVAALGTVYFSAGLPLPEAFEHRVYGALSGGGMNEAGTFTDRMALAEEAWQMSGRTLIIGLGADEFRVVSAHQIPVHVFPLLILTEAGFFGLLGFVGLLAVLWFKALTNISNDPRRGIVCVGVLLIFTLFTMTVPHMYARLWVAPVFLALLVCVRNPAGNRSAGQPSPELPEFPTEPRKWRAGPRFNR